MTKDLVRMSVAVYTKAMIKDGIRESCLAGSSCRLLVSI